MGSEFRDYSCDRCNGGGRVRRATGSSCGNCSGNGWVRRWGSPATCSTCGGDGKEWEDADCSACKGSGTIVKRVHVCDECGSTDHYNCKKETERWCCHCGKRDKDCTCDPNNNSIGGGGESRGSSFD